MPGFPIRTSSDPRSVDNSPRHNAASHVLHRLPVPRHPPCALKHLQHKTVKNSRKNQKLHYQQQDPKISLQMLATTIHKSNTTPHHQSRATTTNPKPYSGRGPHPTAGTATYLRFPTHRDEEIAGLLSQSPIVCPMNFLEAVFPHHLHVCCAPDPHPLQARAIHRTARGRGDPRYAGRPQVLWCSLERR